MRRHSMWAPLLAWLLLLLPAVPASADLSPAEWKVIQKQYAALFAHPGEAADKVSLITRLLADGQPRSLKMVQDAFAKECQLLGEARAAWQQVTMESLRLLDNLADGYTRDEERDMVAMPPRLKAAEEALHMEQAVLGQVLETLVAAPAAVVDGVFLHARTSRDWIHRAAVARLAVSRLPEDASVDVLRRTLSADKDARVRLATIEALGGRHDGWEPWVLDALADPDWSVQLAAVHVVARKSHRSAVPHLIRALAHATPRVAVGICAVLEQMTGVYMDPDVATWASWWDAHHGDFELRGPVGPIRREGFPGSSYFGLSLHSDRVIFVIDISDSMRLLSANGDPAEKWKSPATRQGGGLRTEAPPEEILRGPKIDVAKFELKKAVEKLPSDTKFTIIAFNSGTSVWKDQLVAATDVNKRDAFTWMRALKPYSLSYIEGALRRAFQIAGVLDVDDKHPGATADTIVLLSDGAPTDNHPRKMSHADPEEILDLVNHWNARKTIVLHTIGVDMIDSIDFLKKLAEQNGGAYVDR